MGSPAIISIRIKGNSMKGMFDDGELLNVKVNTDIDGANLCPGMVIIVRKSVRAVVCKESERIIVRKSLSANGCKESEDIIKSCSFDDLSKQDILIVHRLVAVSIYRDQIYVWEKGDYDCIPVFRPIDDVKGVLCGFKRLKKEDSLPAGNAFFTIDAKAWERKNKLLILFCRVAGKCYLPIWSQKKRLTIDNRFGLLIDLVSATFWNCFYCACLLLNYLRGSRSKDKSRFCDKKDVLEDVPKSDKNVTQEIHS